VGGQVFHGMERFVPAAAGAWRHVCRAEQATRRFFLMPYAGVKSRRRPSRVAGFPSGPRPGSWVGGWAWGEGPRGARPALFPRPGGFLRGMADEAGIPQRVSGEMEDIDG